MPLPLAPRPMLWALISIAVLLAALSLGLEVARVEFDVRVTRLQRWFDVDREATVPTWLSASLFLAGALAATALNRADLRVRSRFWTLLAAVLLALSLDETVSIHEEVGDQVQELLGSSGLLTYAWVVPGLAFAGAVALLSIDALKRLPRVTSRLVVAGGTVFVTGAAGMEVVGMELDDAPDRQSRTLPVVTSQTFEELFEMIGLSLFLYGIVSYLTSRSTESTATRAAVVDGPRVVVRKVTATTA